MTADKPSSTVTKIQGDAHTGSGDFIKTVNVGYPIEKHEAILKTSLEQREKELRELHALKSEKDKQTIVFLERERDAIQQQLEQVKSSYELKVEALQARYAAVDKLTGEMPDDLLEAAKAALLEGDETQADDLFRRVEEQEQGSIERAAEAAYQRGLIANDNINYRQAYEHFVRATQLNPDQPDYAWRAGMLADDIAQYDTAIGYYEQALSNYLAQEGEASTHVAALRNNLGVVWQNKGEYDTAIDYYEKALAVDIKTFGEDHPDVARDWNNLGAVWADKGEYEKAIDYYEKALAVRIKSLEDDHPHTLQTIENIALAKSKLGTS